MADSTSEIPAGAIPEEEFQPAQQTSSIPSSGIPEGAIPEEEFQSQEQAYGSPGQQAIAGLEGVGRGVIGPLAPMAEKAMGVSPEAIRGREEVNPWTAGTGEFAGLVLPMLASSGASAGARAAVSAGEMTQEAAAGTSLLAKAARFGTLPGLMGEVGHLATGAIGLSAPVGYAARVGSSVVRNAAEMAMYQASDEASKIVVQDKDAPISAESALANVGLGAAIGGITGGIFTGAISPLWKATAAPKLDEFLKSVKYHLDDDTGRILHDYSGVKALLPEINPLEAGIAKDIPSQEIRSVADQYAASRGLKLNPNIPVLDINPDRSAAIAKAYEQMQHAPNDPKVRKAYNSLIQETMDQWEAIKKTGLKAEPIQEGMENPYKSSVDMITDVRKNNHMWYYPTAQGFGKSGDALPSSFSMISSQVGKDANPAAQAALKKDLADAGFKVSDTMGNYGGVSEPSFLVEHDGSAKAKDALNVLGKKYGQESVLHSTAKPGARFNEIHYSDGRPTTAGFGLDNSSQATKDFTESPQYGKFNLQFNKAPEVNAHPLLAYTNETINGHPVQANDIFRIVHDYFGHAKEGFGFGSKGEENAWYHHMQMYSPDAQKALTSETRGQNSWVNFGPNGAANRANPANTAYAEQKAGIMPGWTRKMTPQEIKAIKLPVSKEKIKYVATKLGKKPVKEILYEGYDHASYAAVQNTFQSLDEDSPINRAAQELGINITPVMKAAMSGEPKAMQIFNELREAQHPEILSGLNDIQQQVNEAVSKHMGVNLDDVAVHSDRDIGHDIRESFLKEYNNKYEPVAKAMEERNAQSAGIRVPDEERRDFGGKIIERGMQDVGTDSPYYKIYSDYAQRVMAKDDIAGMDKLRTELFNRSKSISTDINEKNAFRDIRSMIGDFQERQMTNQDLLIGQEGVMNPSELIARRDAANKMYHNFSKMSEDLSDHVGIGDFRGAGSLKAKLADLSPEEIVKKFSPRGNVDSIPFLQQYFPETLDKVQSAEKQRFLSSSVSQEKGVSSLDLRKLGKALEKTNKNSPEYAHFVLPQEVQNKIRAAQTLMDAVPGIKSSGTAGWISKLTKHMPASALAAVGFMTGHNPISSYILGELAQRMGKDVPEAMKLSYLKYLGSDKAVQAEGFKSMFNFVTHSIKGRQKIMNAANAVLAPGARVLLSNAMPDSAQRTKLDKLVTNAQQQPQQLSKFAESPLGHYMPNHQTALTNATTTQLQYLASIKPQATRLGPLNKPVDPSPMAMARYHRALDIANDPTIVLQHVKDGTVKMSDIQDIKSLYPNLYQQMTQDLTNAMTHRHSDGETIPYKTRIGMSIFMATPLDSTMVPTAIMSAQSAFIKPMPQQGQPQGQGKTKKGTSNLGKSNKGYATTTQAAEADRSNRD